MYDPITIGLATIIDIEEELYRRKIPVCLICLELNDDPQGRTPIHTLLRLIDPEQMQHIIHAVLSILIHDPNRLKYFDDNKIQIDEDKALAECSVGMIAAELRRRELPSLLCCPEKSSPVYYCSDITSEGVRDIGNKMIEDFATT